MEVAPFFVDFHHFLSIFTTLIDFHDLRTFVAIYILSWFTHFFRKFFWAKIAFSATSHVFCMYDLQYDRDKENDKHKGSDNIMPRMYNNAWLLNFTTISLSAYIKPCHQHFFNPRKCILSSFNSHYSLWRFWIIFIFEFWIVPVVKRTPLMRERLLWKLWFGLSNKMSKSRFAVISG